jgi:hypothetical protein
MAVGAPARAKGLVLVLVVDESRMDGDDCLARVCRDFDVASPAAIEDCLIVASAQACRQLALRRTALDLFRRRVELAGA